MTRAERAVAKRKRQIQRAEQRYRQRQRQRDQKAPPAGTSPLPGGSGAATSPFATEADAVQEWLRQREHEPTPGMVDLRPWDPVFTSCEEFLRGEAGKAATMAAPAVKVRPPATEPPATSTLAEVDEEEEEGGHFLGAVGARPLKKRT